ncbi:MAG: hypothetical protein ACRD18_09805 [Terriglobia bacterium]
MKIISTLRPQPKESRKHNQSLLSRAGIAQPLALALAALCLLIPAALLARQKAAGSYTIQIPPQPDYSALDWMLGVWTGKTTGKGTQGQVLLSVSYELGKRFIILREQLSLPATKDAPATHEGVMGILNASATGGFEMNLYSSNGFISHYRVIVNHGEVNFSPEGGALPPPGWLFRRIFRHTNPGECTESVEVAPPQGTFFNYYTADLYQVTPAATTPAKPSGKGTASGGKEQGTSGE